MHETRDSGENNEMWFLYQGHSYKEDSEYLGSCAETYVVEDDLDQVLI